MNPSENKPRCDAILKNLPADQQADIVEYTRTHPLRATAQWLAGRGITISATQIGIFLHWHAMQQKFTRNDATWEVLADQRRHGNPLLNDREIDALGLRFFALQALNNEDLRGFVALRKLALIREKFEFDAALFCRRELPALFAIEGNAALNHDQKTQLFREKMFGRPPQET